MAEYAAVYGGPPAPRLPWPLFLGMVQRAARFDARRQLGVLRGVAEAIAAAFGSDGARSHEDRLMREAYPVEKAGPGFIPNLAHPEEAGLADG